MENEHKLIRSAGIVGLATSLSRIFGYFRDATLALVLGAGFSMDAFTIAFRVANLFRRLVGEGAMSSAFVPVFVAYRKEQSTEALWEFTRKFFYTLAMAAGTIVVLEVIFAPLIVHVVAPGFTSGGNKFQLTVLLTRLMAPYLALIALAAVLMGVLNSFGHFLVPALSPVLFNIAVIGAAFLAGYVSDEPAVGIACGVLIGGGLQLVSQIPFVRRKGMNFRPGFSIRHPAIRRFAALLGPGIFGVGVIQMNVFIDSLMASLLREGSVSQLYYADRVMELVLGVFVISMATVILPDLAQCAAERDTERLKSTLLFSFRATAFVAIPATVGLFLLAEPIIGVLFERGRFGPVDTERTAMALMFYALGLCFISGVRLIVSAFYAIQDTKTPVRIAFVALGVNVILNWILMHPLKQGGIALATSLASLLSFIQLAQVFQKKVGPLDWRALGKSVTKILIASVAMGCFSLLGLHWCQFNVSAPIGWKTLALFSAIAGGVFAYLVASMLLKVEELAILGHLVVVPRKRDGRIA
ncbi:MAG: murein biosynthesis integral membrane protein MurJ [Omnitrophica bacterium RIFCSPHIGHO2_02_FULL_49_9]|nr:MAG: murein biosynthesis integral membrane protein MurJ [Omnitrophica bacterium RIFCSPHIGHO2_02_FULL_49_9]OGX06840.1 MAG: murein biosynthesis integral membrane protein MurJ [Omnitrophica bacterium RIFCSPLOWO2_12_FULL_50_11]